MTTQIKHLISYHLFTKTNIFSHSMHFYMKFLYRSYQLSLCRYNIWWISDIKYKPKKYKTVSLFKKLLILLTGQIKNSSNTWFGESVPGSSVATSDYSNQIAEKSNVRCTLSNLVQQKFFPVLLSYNWHTLLNKFQVYSIHISLIYIINQLAQEVNIHHLI